MKVMSFNIRFGTANDGNNHWEHRRECVAETIRLCTPDLLGVQEALDFQCAYLEARFPDLQFFGRSREVNPTSGEYCGIYYLRDRFELVDSGHFWLSENPDQPGSKSWDSSLPRMVSWVRLRDLQSSHREFTFANTHFDHRGPTARLESAKLIRRRLAANESLPLVLTGDFNSSEASEPYQALVNATLDSTRNLRDSFREINPNPTEQEGTFSAWVGDTTGPRIDWILHTDELTVLDASINHLRWRGRFPSDHFPVQAVLLLESQ